MYTRLKRIPLAADALLASYITFKKSKWIHPAHLLYRYQFRRFTGIEGDLLWPRVPSDAKFCVVGIASACEG